MNRVSSMLAYAAAAVFTVLAPSAQASPYPAGYEQAFRFYLSQLTPAQRRVSWLTFHNLQGIPHQVMLNCTPILVNTGCMPHSCDRNQVIVYFVNPRVSTAVIVTNGRRRRVGAASDEEFACAVAFGLNENTCNGR